MQYQISNLFSNKSLFIISAILIATLHVNQFYYSYDAVKWFVFDVCLSLFIFCNWPKNNEFRISYLGCLFIVLAALMLVSLFYAPNLAMSLEFIFRFILVFISGYILITLYPKRAVLGLLLNAAVLSAFFFSVLFIFERYVLELPYSVGSFSPLGFKNNAAQVFNIWVPCLVLYVFLNRHCYWRAVGVTAILVFIISVMMEAGTRGGVVGLIIGELIVFCIMLFQNPKRAIYFLSITLLLSSGMMLYKFSDDLRGGNLSERLIIMEGNISSSTDARWLMFYNTWEMALDNPQGVGINNFEYVHPKYGKPGTNLSSPYINEHQILRTPHNIVLKLYSELGLVGGSFFLILLGYFLFSSLFNAIKGSLIDKWLLVGVVATLFHSLVSAVFLTPASLFFSFLLFTVTQSRFIDIHQFKFKLDIRFNLLAKWSALSIPVLSACLLMSSFYSYHGSMQFSARLLNKALVFNPHNERALFTLSHVHYRRHKNSQSSLDVIDRFLSINPYHLAGVYIQSERQFQLGETRLARESIENLLDIYPSFQKALRLKQAIDLKLH